MANDAGLAALRAAVPDVSRETELALQRYAALFSDWSRRINLVAASTEADFWQRHVADSAQLLKLKPDARHWVDLGSGGGFPGMVIAILLAQKPDARIDLVESNRKKAAFLQTVRAACAPGVHVHAARIEDVLPRISPPAVVTARALAPLPKLLEMTEPWLSDRTIALFHKGRGYADELRESRAIWAFDLVEHQSLVAADSVILEIADLRRTTPNH